MKTVTIKILAITGRTFLAEVPSEFSMLVNLPIKVLGSEFSFNQEFELSVDQDLLEKSIIW